MLGFQYFLKPGERKLEVYFFSDAEQESMLQHKNSRPQLAGLAAILSYFHPLPCLTETTYFVGNTPITERAPCPDCSAYDILSEKELCVENPDLKEEPFWRL